jgi:hypothetical protein
MKNKTLMVSAFLILSACNGALDAASVNPAQLQGFTDGLGKCAN